MQHEPADDFDVVQTWFMSQAAALIQRFKSTSEGRGSMLDNMAILVISEQSDGRNHTAIPTLGFLAGKAGGGIKTGGAIVGRRSSLNDFYMGLAGVFGQKLSTFGEAKLCKAPLALA